MLMRPDSVRVDTVGIVRSLPARGVAESVQWRDLARLDVVTWVAGPFSRRAYVLLHGKSGNACAVPFDLAGRIHLLERLECLPAFDMARASGLGALAQVSPRQFAATVWQGDLGSSLDSFMAAVAARGFPPSEEAFDAPRRRPLALGLAAADFAAAALCLAGAATAAIAFHRQRLPPAGTVGGAFLACWVGATILLRRQSRIVHYAGGFLAGCVLLVAAMALAGR